MRYSALTLAAAPLVALADEGTSEALQVHNEASPEIYGDDITVKHISRRYSALTLAAATEITPLLLQNFPEENKIQRAKQMTVPGDSVWVALADEATCEALQEHIEARPEIYGDNTTVVMHITTSRAEYDYRLALFREKHATYLGEMADELANKFPYELLKPIVRFVAQNWIFA